ncbi:MAG: diaminobutyrate--2-oxoglutarate transaminase [Clostridia bacterium]|nr:diaminobutyrate--2-oxoglutarate transaminase [Clostridia bacterium]
MNTKVFEQYESEVRSYCRKFPEVFVSSKGAYIHGESGRDYLDFFCGAGALNYGHNHPHVQKQVVDYLMSDGIIHALDMYTVAKRDFLETFQEKVLKPRGLDYKVQFPGPTGTNAVEAALKLARKVKGRRTVMGLMGCFHGMTLGSLALTCERDARAGAGVPLNDVVHVPAPYMFPELDTIDYVDQILSDDHSGVEHPAAFILETVQAEGGIQVFSVDFLKRLRALCDKHDMLLIVDDIQVGCGRTGTFFSFERAGIQPDIVTLSKSIGGLGLPLALTLFRPELDIWSPGEHNGTFRGNQVAFVAAKAAIDVMVGEGLDANVRENEAVLREGLEKIAAADERLKVRGIGYIWGIDCEGLGVDGFARKVICKCFDNGLICELAGRKDAVVKLMPPLIADRETLEKGLAIVEASLNECLSQL